MPRDPAVRARAVPAHVARRASRSPTDSALHDARATTRLGRRGPSRPRDTPAHHAPPQCPPLLALKTSSIPSLAPPNCATPPLRTANQCRRRALPELRSATTPPLRTAPDRRAYQRPCRTAIALCSEPQRSPRRASPSQESEDDRTDEDREYREELGDDYCKGSYDSEGYSD
ncbi:uncharacterized protein LOC110431357 isoform X1 [Sorghum bicolor]|uniref:uncharacterized protein LOC110431357 isoform X1 n=1 Tax=Sorghum bicolor TaxID=4558 RepID=UPI000B425845|nr:uncharacterized protein LOC110431357 isoform X1 [Sorghum bicolor]|eukprot:XP_021306081.1 uncharacterized protein LOC110431357 isoform X1 [Sorghum bicolor]